MVYASETPAADYAEKSIYASTNATGSGTTPHDKAKFLGTVEILKRHFSDHKTTILDVGCAQGGLLRELFAAGYDNAVGMDPSESCVDACYPLLAYCGKLEDPATDTYDLVVLSHVVEHLWDVPTSLQSVRDRVKNDGHVYIEVPNAVRYAETAIPFLDFNREHINHFSMSLLVEVLYRAGFSVVASGERYLDCVNGGKYPAMYVIAKKGVSLRQGIEAYIKKSQAQMDAIDAALKPRIADREIILWGFGEFSQQLFLTDAVKSAHVIQVVDRDFGKQGKVFNGLTVESPDYINSDAAILVASILNASSIQQDIRNRGLSNEVICL
jgi:SAM-dependent methyltransferase